MKKFSLAVIALSFLGLATLEARAEGPGFGPVGPARTPGITNSSGFAAVNSHGFRAPVPTSSTRININVRVNVRAYNNHYYPQYYQAYQNYYNSYYQAYAQWMAMYYRYMYARYRRPRKAFSLAISTPFFGLGLSSVRF
ncbi:MAG: hypothetical protein KDD51_09420 [Bdellovibrionales bacterium]|nr:hypothetical protein [Bdellovibrionales bacterium]